MRNLSNVMLKSLWPVALAQATGGVFNRPNNPIGCLHSSSFHTSLCYLHEQLQLGVVVGYCRPCRARVYARVPLFTGARRSFPARHLSFTSFAGSPQRSTPI